MAEATSNWPLASSDVPPPVLQLGQCSAMVGLQALPRPGVGAGDPREILGIRGGLACDGQLPAGELEVEVGLGDCAATRRWSRSEGRPGSRSATRRAASGSKIASEIRKIVLRPFNEGKPVPGDAGREAVGQRRRSAEE